MRETVDVASIARRFTSQSVGHGVGKMPKYLRLSNALLDAIESGDFRPGSRIPGERDLTNVLPVSLGTIQKAMNDLVAQGVVCREAGRGTFVAGARQDAFDSDQVANQDLVHFRFEADDRRSLLPVYLDVLSIDKIAPLADGRQTPWSRFLDTDGAFVRIDRILNVADLFEGFCRFYLPFARYGALLDYSPEELSGKTLRNFLNRTFDMPTLHFDHKVQCGPLPAVACKRLGIERESSGTTWQIFGRSYRSAPASYQLVYLPAGHRPIEFAEKLE